MNAKKITDFLFELASMRRLTRSHRQFVAEVCDNIADHSYRVAVIGMILAKLEDCDENKVLKIGLFHDIAESRTGDANHLNKQYTKMDEDAAVKDQLQDLPIEEDILNLIEEYEIRESKEAIVAKDADVLDQIILQREYFFKDQKNHDIWQKAMQKLLRTESAKKLAEQIVESNPLEWLYSILEKKRGKEIER